uniref:Uncharacterized protein n=1 Tax=Anguilla anguilla TaxID=7936 RepID=A0A0E9QFA9_ANGAN
MLMQIRWCAGNCIIVSVINKWIFSFFFLIDTHTLTVGWIYHIQKTAQLSEDVCSGFLLEHVASSCSLSPLLISFF